MSWPDARGEASHSRCPRLSVQSSGGLDPRCYDARIRLAYALHGSGRLDEASEEYQRAIAIDSRAPAHESLGLMLADLGRMDEAIASLREAVRLAPDRTSARNELVKAPSRMAGAGPRLAPGRGPSSRRNARSGHGAGESRRPLVRHEARDESRHRRGPRRRAPRAVAGGRAGEMADAVERRGRAVGARQDGSLSSPAPAAATRCSCAGSRRSSRSPWERVGSIGVLDLGNQVS